MKISRDSRLLIIVLVVLAVGMFFIALANFRKPDSPSSYSAGKRGTKALYLELKGLGFNVARQTKTLKKLPRDASVMFLIEPSRLRESDVELINRWVRKGNTLILVSSNPFGEAREFGIAMESTVPPAETVMIPVQGRYSDGVGRVSIQPSAYVADFEEASPILKNKKGIIAADLSRGAGRIVVCSDPLIFANSRIGKHDNVVLLTNLVYRNAGKNDRVLFAEYDRIRIDAAKEEPKLSRGTKLAILHIAIAAIVLLIGLGRRFGAIHPLEEDERHLRGWEYVRAVATLYKRAGASQVALTSIYQSFHRELVLRFGASPTATPEQTADAVFRARNVDRAKLTALLKRCDAIASGQEISEGDAIALTRTMEEFRKELGIARTDR